MKAFQKASTFLAILAMVAFALAIPAIAQQSEGSKTPQGTTSPGMTHDQKLSGTVVSVDSTAKTIKVKNDQGMEQTVNTDSSTQIRSADLSAELSDLKPGDHIVVMMKSEAGRMVASNIEVHKGAQTPDITPRTGTSGTHPGSATSSQSGTSGTQSGTTGTTRKEGTTGTYSGTSSQTGTTSGTTSGTAGSQTGRKEPGTTTSTQTQRKEPGTTTGTTREEASRTGTTGAAKSDRNLIRQVRKALSDDKSLSREAHNVKVSAQNGTVTLKGTVKSDEEKNRVAEIAKQVSGVTDVVNNIEVKGSEPGRPRTKQP